MREIACHVRQVALGLLVAANLSYGQAALQPRAMVNRYCSSCHSEKLHVAGLVLDKADLSAPQTNAALWEKVIEKLRTGAMPPAGAPRPDPASYESLATYLEDAIDKAAAAHPRPGRIAIHRLNRAEYTNAIRDLLAVQLDGEPLLPADDSGYGFDNIADILSVSSALLERYMLAAGKVSRLAIGDAAIRPSVETYEIPAFLVQDDRMNEDLPFGSRGGAALHHNFPVDGEYVLKIALQRGGNSHDEKVLGLAEAHQLDVRLDGVRVKSFTIGGKTAGKGKAADDTVEVRFPAKAGSRLVAIQFVEETAAPEGPLQPHNAEFRFLDKSSSSRSEAVRAEDVLPALGSVSIAGPYNPAGVGDTASRRKIFSCVPAGAADEIPCARKILSTLARRAYRRPLTEGDVQALMGLYKAGREPGGFEAGISTAIQGIIVSPAFLFRMERDPANIAPGTAYRIGDFELASRLSFFLWSSIPDDQLLDVAAQGKLKDPAVLEQQVRRMLADSRSSALVTNFVGQWLYLRNLDSVHPDPEAFPDFDDSLRDAFQQEARLFFESNLREDRSVLNLVNANYTFLNERLAKFYGIPNVYGSHFRRVTLNLPERSGMLGEGGILTVTSYANRTAPTIRGKWLLENLIGAPPPPPPANVPSLKEDNIENGKTLTMRQRMEEHRKNPVCASCHARMDPLGFSLENFDGVGKWRSAEGNSPIDPAGVLPDGTKLKGPADLRQVLLDHPRQFAATVADKLMRYGLGRGTESYDAPAVRKIVHDAAASDYKWSSLIIGVVESVPFQMRTSRAQDQASLKTASVQKGSHP